VKILSILLEDGEIRYETAYYPQITQIFQRGGREISGA